MINSSLINYLEKRLTQELPGIKAHLEVAPYRKVDFTKEAISKAILSSVLILFYEKEEELYTTLIQRTIYKGNHSGQISFPGGKMEKTDASLIETALRETEEEIGILSNQVSVIGHLSNVFIPVSNFCITPVIGCITSNPSFSLNQREVSAVIELKLVDLLNDQSIQNRKIQLANKTIITVPCFVFGENIVWGATALILNELKHLLNEFNF